MGNSAHTRGKFIVMEGLDGAGKTSCIDYLKTELKEDIVYSFEPGGTAFGMEIRAMLKKAKLDPLTQLLLFVADRREHMTTTIIPALESGKHVICDRFMASTYAYQIIASDMEAHEQFFWDIHRTILDDYTPDQYFFVTVTPEIARERIIKNRGLDHFEEHIEFQKKVREGYEAFFQKIPAKIIDGGVELLTMQKEALGLVKDALRS